MFEREQEDGRGRLWLQRIFLLALGVLASLVLAEIGIRVAGILAPFGRDGSVDGGHFVVLCVGDSHTWGNGRGYPRRLSQRLAALSEEYRVINLGVPGTNTAQLRNRFATFLERYDPSLVVIWTGVNNRWNRSETEVWSEAEVAPASLAARALDEVRLLRLVRLWLNERALNRIFAEETYLVPERSKETKDGQTHRRLQLAAEAEEFLNRKGASLSSEEARRVTELDFRWLIDTARASFVPVVVITYPQVMGSWFLDANRGIEAAANATGTPVVSGAEAVNRILHRYRSRGLRPPNLMDRSIHPAEPVYRAIGDMVFEAIERDRLLPERSGEGAL